MNIVPFNFDAHVVRVVEDGSGEPWFVAADIAIALEYGEAKDMVRMLDEDEKGRHIVPTPSGAQEMLTVNEAGLFAAILKSRKAEAKRFKRWVTHDVLPSIRKSGSYSMPTTQRRPALSRNQVAAGILLLRSAAEDLKFAPSAVLGGYQRLESQLGVTGLLPGYSVDAPSTSAVGSSEETKAVGDLLKQFGVSMSARAFNLLLEEHGFLEERERPSSKGGTKKFKVCTDLEYGKNLTSPNNPRETQPHWFVSKFQELLELVLPPKPKAVKS